jgi:protein-tyrosine phosphatase
MTRHRTVGQSLDRGPSFTFHEVAPGLYQGDFPDGDVDWDHFDDVISMTTDVLPRVRLRADGLWLRVPILDDEMTDPAGVRNAALTAAERVGAGRRVLVHCWAGLNRSGVVTARALMAMGTSVTEAIAAVRESRGPYALSNRAFVEWLYEEAGEPVPEMERWRDHGAAMSR